MNANPRTVTSKDGTAIAYETSGNGPVIILVGAALTDRTGMTKLTRLLAEDFTVVNYDRRGRGGSGDAGTYAVDCEVGDLESLVEAVGKPAYLFGNSSGGVLALDAASKLGGDIKGVFLYEPPLIVDDSRPPVPDADLARRTDELALAGRRNAAVRLFFTKGMGIPAPFVWMMRIFMPGWSKMAKIAHTISYDLRTLAGLQDGKQLPAERWSGVTAPTMVMVGSKSQKFFHTGAEALVSVLSTARYQPLPGGSHGSIQMNPGGLAKRVTVYLLGLEGARPRGTWT